eukprot:jgi/Tetstr1/442900/TSEL_030963.t1
MRLSTSTSRQERASSDQTRPLAGGAKANARCATGGTWLRRAGRVGAPAVPLVVLLLCWGLFSLLSLNVGEGRHRNHTPVGSHLEQVAWYGPRDDIQSLGGQAAYGLDRADAEKLIGEQDALEQGDSQPRGDETVEAGRGTEGEGEAEEGAEAVEYDEKGERLPAGSAAQSAAARGEGAWPPGQAGQRPGARYLECPRVEPPQPVGLEGLSLTLSHGGSTEQDLFITQANHRRLLPKGQDVHNKSVSLLPPAFSSVVDSFAWGSCAVVGNGGGLTLANFGSAVDSHDIVMRTNQAPTYSAYYRKLVGQRTSFRLLNHLWSANYAFRLYKKNLPLERNAWLIISRASGHIFDKLAGFLSDERPDVRVLMLSGRTVGLARRLLLDYRIRLCQAGSGPYPGGAVPSSGLVSVLLLMQMCRNVTVYGFGSDQPDPTRRAEYPGKRLPHVPYHYFVGHQARAVGMPVHSWPAEERLLTALHKAGRIQFCRPELLARGNAGRHHNHNCGRQPQRPDGRGFAGDDPAERLAGLGGAAGAEATGAWAQPPGHRPRKLPEELSGDEEGGRVGEGKQGGDKQPGSSRLQLEGAGCGTALCLPSSLAALQRGVQAGADGRAGPGGGGREELETERHPLGGGGAQAAALVCRGRQAGRMQVAGVTEEEIIKKRLLTQTAVGHKGDPPLAKLTKRYLQFGAKLLAPEGEEADAAAARRRELEELHGHLVRDIASIELLAEKRDIMCKVHKQEGQSYQRKRQELMAAIEQAKADIEAKKGELAAARAVRQHNEEYEKLRGLVVEFPRCADMQAQIDAAQSRLDATRSANVAAASLIGLRKKQFALLLHTIASLTGEVESPAAEEGEVGLGGGDGLAAMET